MSVCSWWHPVVWILLLELLLEFCYYNPMDLLHHLEKGKEELSPWQYHIKSLHIISRHYKKSLLRSQIYHGYEELSMDTNYPIWRRQERRSKYVVQLASWQLRWNSPKTSVCLSVRPSVRPSITRQKLHINRSVVLGADESPWPCGTPSWYTPLSWIILSKQKNLHLFSSQYICVFSKTSVPHPMSAL